MSGFPWRAAIVRKILTDASLIVLSHERTLVFIASIEKRELERQRRVVEQRRVLRPCDDGAW